MEDAVSIPARLVSAAALLCAATLAFAQPDRSGEQVVKQQCAACHESGLHGAPRIDDRAAWAPRMRKGLDATVRSAIRGHGKMPARGGLADLTDAELRSAILYLFNPAGVPVPAAAPPALGNHRTVDGTDIFLGVLRKKGNLHVVTVTLRDARTHAPIAKADVRARVTNPVMGAEARQLAEGRTGDVVSYGAEFTLSGKEPHVITVQVRRPDRDRTLEARFDYKS